MKTELYSTVTVGQFRLLFEENGYRNISSHMALVKEIKPDYTSLIEIIPEKLDLNEYPGHIKMFVKGPNNIYSIVRIYKFKEMKIKEIENSLYLENLIIQRIFQGREVMANESFNYSNGKWSRQIPNMSNYKISKRIKKDYTSSFSLQAKLPIKLSCVDRWISVGKITEDNISKLYALPLKTEYYCNNKI